MEGILHERWHLYNEQKCHSLAADSAVTIGQHLAIHNSAMTSAELKHRVKVTVKPPRAGLPQQRPVSAGVVTPRV